MVVGRVEEGLRNSFLKTLPVYKPLYINALYYFYLFFGRVGRVNKDKYKQEKRYKKRRRFLDFTQTLPKNAKKTAFSLRTARDWNGLKNPSELLLFF